MASTQTRRRHTTFAHWVAVVAMAATSIAPVPGWSQSGSGGAQQGADGESAERASSDGTEASAAEEETASSGQTPSLYMIPVERVQDSISTIVPDRIDDLVRNKVTSDNRVELQPTLMGAQAKRGGTAGSRAVAQARKQYRSGIGLVSAGEYERAVETLSTSVATMKKHIEHLSKFPVLVDALKNLARAYDEAGYDFDARTTMREFAHLNPEAELDEKKFSDKMRKIYRAEVKKVQGAGTGQLHIEATSGGDAVEGAVVEIDGQNKGKTPVTVTDVGFGYHYLVVRGPDGGTVATKQLQVRGRNQKQTFSVALEADGADRANASKESKESAPAFYTDLQESLRSGRFDQSSLKPYLEELSEQADASLIAWVLMTRDDTGYNAIPFAYRTSDGRLVKGDAVEFDIQLSNLRSGVATLSERVVTTALDIDEVSATTSVALVGEAESVEASQQATSDAQTTDSSAATAEASSDRAAGSEADTRQGDRVDPPPTPTSPTDDERSGISPWWYVAGSAVVVGGLAAGGAWMLSNPSNPSRPSGFEAQVSW